MFKFIVTIVVLLIAAGALWWTGLLSQWVPSIPNYSSLMGAKEATTTPEVPQQQPTAVNDLPTAANDASDDAIAKDAAAIDVEMQALAGDSTSAQGSLDDKPVTQEY